MIKAKRLILIAIATALGFWMGTAIVPEIALAQKTYSSTDKLDVRGKLEADNWTVLYAEEFSKDDWVKLTAALAADALGCSGGCNSAFITSFGYQSYDTILRQLGQKSPNLVGSFSTTISKTNFGSLLASAIKNGRVESINLPGVRLEVGNATYSRNDKCPMYIKIRCPRLTKSYQPYARVKFLAGK